ncbi:hypothetical protein ABZ403_01810 [Micromonospora zamorensis]|uniref:hypothetical protein n=1 Tax=Micromonospora zamorensis TaxID=709883 RepID=UPI0033E27160
MKWNLRLTAANAGIWKACPATKPCPRLPHPTLILTWETDPGHPVSTAVLLARVLPDAHLHVSATAADIPTSSDRIGTVLAG